MILYLSISLSIYIYIYIYGHTGKLGPLCFQAVGLKIMHFKMLGDKGHDHITVDGCRCLRVSFDIIKIPIHILSVS